MLNHAIHPMHELPRALQHLLTRDPAAAPEAGLPRRETWRAGNDSP